MIEAEIKARVRDVTAVRSQLQERDLRQAISDLNQRLCYAAGEYDSRQLISCCDIPGELGSRPRAGDVAAVAQVGEDQHRFAQVGVAQIGSAQVGSIQKRNA